MRRVGALEFFIIIIIFIIARLHLGRPLLFLGIFISTVKPWQQQQQLRKGRTAAEREGTCVKNVKAGRCGWFPSGDGIFYVVIICREGHSNLTEDSEAHQMNDCAFYE